MGVLRWLLRETEQDLSISNERVRELLPPDCLLVLSYKGEDRKGKERLYLRRAGQFVYGEWNYLDIKGFKLPGHMELQTQEEGPLIVSVGKPLGTDMKNIFRAGGTYSEFTESVNQQEGETIIKIDPSMKVDPKALFNEVKLIENFFAARGEYFRWATNSDGCAGSPLPIYYLAYTRKSQPENSGFDNTIQAELIGSLPSLKFNLEGWVESEPFEISPKQHLMRLARLAKGPNVAPLTNLLRAANGD